MISQLQPWTSTPDREVETINILWNLSQPQYTTIMCTVTMGTGMVTTSSHSPLILWMREQNSCSVMTMFMVALSCDHLIYIWNRACKLWKCTCGIYPVYFVTWVVYMSSLTYTQPVVYYLIVKRVTRNRNSWLWGSFMSSRSHFNCFSQSAVNVGICFTTNETNLKAKHKQYRKFCSKLDKRGRRHWNSHEPTNQLHKEMGLFTNMYHRLGQSGNQNLMA